MSPLNWPFGGWPADSTVIIVAATAAVTFVAFHYGAPARAWQRWLGDDADGQAHAVYAQRLAGAVLLGVVPALIAAAALPFSVFDLGLGPGDPLRGGLALAGILVLSLPAVILASRGPDFADDYPLIRAVGWSRRRRLANAGTWALYLLGYEFFFRGFMLVGLAHALGPWPAIALTTLAYVFGHLPKPAGETIGTLPMGIVFAAATLWAGSILPAFFAHLVIANASDLLAHRQRTQRANQRSSR